MKINLIKNNTLKKYDSIFVGFSGGADSTALLLLLKEFSINNKTELIAVHFEHGIRGSDSLEDEIWCRSFCKKEEIKYLSYQLNVPNQRKSGESLEEAARRLRLEKWELIVENNLSENKKIAIALAHHKNDKIENMFLRIIRGANSSGITSMRETTQIGKIEIIRPLLAYSKSDLVEYLQLLGINNWREDSTNNESEYRRNFIRNEIFPLVEKKVKNFSQTVNSTYAVLEEDAKYLENVSKSVYRDALDIKTNELIISRLPLSTAILSRVMRYWINDMLNQDVILTRPTIMRIAKSLELSADTLISINKYLLMKIRRGRISLLGIDKRKMIETQKELTWNLNKDKEVIFNEYKISVEVRKKDDVDFQIEKDISVFPKEMVLGEITIRKVKSGDRIIPFGGRTAIKVNKIFQNKKIDKFMRNSIPLVVDANKNILWLCGVLRSNFYPVEKKTEDILVFKCFKLEK